MNVMAERCTGCGLCLKHCPMRAIKITARKARVDQDLCAECEVCYRVGVCTEDAFEPARELAWPRSIRSIFSNPLTEFKETGVTGRGTEEMKTNDVTGRFRSSMLGVCVDVGRPNVGATLKDVEVITRAVAPLGVEFEGKNPVTYVMRDRASGQLDPAVLSERVVSAVVEFTIPPEKLRGVLEALQAVAPVVDTVFSVGVICRMEDGDHVPALDQVRGWGDPDFAVGPHSKVNAGLGRPGSGPGE